MPYYEIEPDAVYSAAKATYATAADWQSWASTSKGALVDASASSAEPRVSAAFESYLTDVQPALTSLPILAANQGTTTAQAVNVVSDAQTESLGIYSGEYAAAEDAYSTLNRPLNAE